MTPVLLTLWIVVTAFLYVLCGRLLWNEIEAADRLCNPQEHALCPVAHAGNWQAAFVRRAFVALWPSFLVLGAALQARGSIQGPRP